MRRPSILNKDKKLSKNVKGIILDRDGDLIGLILTTKEHSFIQFLDKVSPIIVFDKRTGEFEIVKEYFSGDPKKVLKKIISFKIK